MDTFAFSGAYSFIDTVHRLPNRTASIVRGLRCNKKAQNSHWTQTPYAPSPTPPRREGQCVCQAGRKWTGLPSASQSCRLHRHLLCRRVGISTSIWMLMNRGLTRTDNAPVATVWSKKGSRDSDYECLLPSKCRWQDWMNSTYILLSTRFQGNMLKQFGNLCDIWRDFLVLQITRHKIVGHVFTWGQHSGLFSAKATNIFMRQWSRRWQII